MNFSVRRGISTAESIIRHVVVEKEYNPAGYEIGPNDVVIDVGGNIGAFSVSAASAAVNGRVISFEPEPGNYALLKRNLARNGCTNATPLQAAVSDTDGMLQLHLNPSNLGGHSLLKRDGVDASQSVAVPAIAFRKVFDDYKLDRCDFLKMDCEGAEYQILYGLPREYFPRIRRLVMEYHTESEGDRETPARLVAFLQDVGFRIDRYTRIVGGMGGLLYATRL